MTTFGFDKAAPQASLHHLAEMLRSAVDAIISIDATGTIESVNPATQKLFGYAAGELIGQNVKMLMPEPYRSQHDGYIFQYRHTGQRKIIGIGREVVGQRKNGSTFPMHLSVSEYEIEGKRRFAGIVHDLSAQKQAEAESARHQTLFQAIGRVPSLVHFQRHDETGERIDRRLGSGVGSAIIVGADFSQATMPWSRPAHQLTMI